MRSRDISDRQAAGRNVANVQSKSASIEYTAAAKKCAGIEGRATRALDCAFCNGTVAWVPLENIVLIKSGQEKTLMGKGVEDYLPMGDIIRADQNNAKGERR